MAEETQITPLNFNTNTFGKSINDKKNALDIVFGHISGLPERLKMKSDIAIALMDRGMGQYELDLACQKLAGDCTNQKLQTLITKSDLPFDARWYIIGDITALLDLAEQDRISLPFSNFLYDEIRKILDQG